MESDNDKVIEMLISRQEKIYEKVDSIESKLDVYVNNLKWLSGIGYAIVSAVTIGINWAIDLFKH